MALEQRHLQRHLQRQRFNAAQRAWFGLVVDAVLHLRSAFRLSGQVDHCEAAQAAQKRCS